ncbi:MAG: hypothetical protein GY928_21315 [Colwellia sp.]|nr:hypothetical protein [Colwellia sp.]
MATVNTTIDWFGTQKKKDMTDGMIVFLTKGINLVDGTAKNLVPVDKGILRGSLIKEVNPSNLTATESTNIEYAPYVEFGLKSNPNYPKQPYLRPALNNNIAKLIKMAKIEVRKAVDK